MLFNDHSNLEGQHAFLSASKHHWINYDNDKLSRVYLTHMSAQRGTELHAFAMMAINLGIKQSRSAKTLNMYINDAIGFRMTTEQTLYFSPNAFGTADTISFRNNMLRIHDLKTGVIRGSIHQLEIYAAMFCLEYRINPSTIDIELRIYQTDEVVIVTPEASVIEFIMEKIILFDKQIEKLRIEEYV